MLLFVLFVVADQAGKFPLQNDVILMRRPGEALDQRHRELMEKLPETLGLALATPLVVASLPLL